MKQSLYLVAGLGKTGHSIAGYLQRRNLPFVVFDTRKNVEGLAEFNQEFPGVDVFLEELPATIYSQLIEIIASPGIGLDEPFIQEARRLHIPVIGDLECFARHVKAPVIAITGTNGKSTVTSLVGEMAKSAGLSVAVAGNIGTPVLDLLDSNQHYDLWVLELSSFQLDLLYSLAPVAAVILNISPDHLDRHHTMAAYIAAKQRVYKQANVIIYNRDDNQTLPVETYRNSETAIINYGLGKPDASQWGIIEQGGNNFLAHGDECLLSVENLRLKGKHNWENVLAACALATAAGIKKTAIVTVLQSFAGLPHRCQWIRTLDGVDWINDSKGTNIGATISAIAGIGGAMHGKIVLIAGGLGKGADFCDLRQVVTEYVRTAVLIGTDANKIEAALSDLIPVSHAANLEDAVLKARSEAKAGDVVLLSPACASLDMFRDFNHRGELFASLVEQL